MSKVIAFEQPLNERMRTFMRVEQLYARCLCYLHKDNAWDTHHAVATLIELYNLVTRGDLKRELLKEINRQQSTLNQLSHIAEIDQHKLASINNDLASLALQLDQIEGQLLTNLKEHDFINSIKQRIAIPGGACDFDLPAYHYWLAQNPQIRKDKILAWLAPFDIVQRSVSMCLQLIRESSRDNDCVAQLGFYQLTLDPNQPNQIIRVLIDSSYQCYPEMSAGKHRISIRFLHHVDPDENSSQVKRDVNFRLGCCSF